MNHWLNGEFFFTWRLVSHEYSWRGNIFLVQLGHSTKQEKWKTSCSETSIKYSFCTWEVDSSCLGNHLSVKFVCFDSSVFYQNGSIHLIISLCPEKHCVCCNSYMRQNLRLRCSLIFEFGTYEVIKCIFMFF